MKLKELLRSLSCAHGVSGYEKNVRDILRKLVMPCTSLISMDKIENLICKLETSYESKPKIMVASHMDEVGALVTRIDKRGFLYIDPIGIIDPKIFVAKDLIVHGEKGHVEAIANIKPSSFLTRNESGKTIKFKDIFLDIGVSCRKEALKYVNLGNVVSFKENYREIKNDIIKAKSLDNRAGCAVMIEVMKHVFERKTPSVYIVFTAQEEIGSRGAKVATYQIDPDIAVIVDAVSASIYLDSKIEDLGIELGKGPCVFVGPLISSSISKTLIKIAESNNLKFQLVAVSGRTYTDSDIIQIVKNGVAVGIIGIPIRYIHTNAEVVNINDLEETIRLLTLFLSHISSASQYS